MSDPRAFAVTETLRNGLVVTFRALRSDDRDRMAEAVRGLDRDSIYLRLFSHRTELTEAGLDRIMRFDSKSEVVLVATIGSGTEEGVIGAGRYMAGPPGGGQRQAKVAFTVDAHYHGLGIAGRLLGHLVTIARGMRIAVFEADVLAENAAMLKVFARSGLPMQKRRDGSVVHVELSL